jgi:outer membrane protein assembly factor BamB
MLTKSLTLMAAVIGLCLVVNYASAQNRKLIVAGFHSDNVVEFDLSTGASREIINSIGDPRGLTVNSQGDIFVGLRNGTQNILKLTNDGNGNYASSNFTNNPFGQFGPGMFEFHSNGNLFVAGDNSMTLFEFNGSTGSLIRSFSITGTSTVLGLTINDDDLFVAEYFADQIQKYDISSPPYSGSHIIDDPVNLSRPLGITYNHVDNWLTIANETTGQIQLYDDNNDYVGLLFTAVDPRGIIFDDLTETYFLSDDDSVIQIDRTGAILNTFTHNGLAGTYGLAIIGVPEPNMAIGLVCVVACIGFRRNRR